MSRRPPHHPVAELCLEAWNDLSTERAFTIASGISGQTHWTRVQYGSIPWSKVRLWCKDQGLDRDNRQLVWSVIQQLEASRMEREASQRRLDGGN